MPAPTFRLVSMMRAQFERRLGPRMSQFLRAQAGKAATSYGVAGLQGVAARIRLDTPTLQNELRVSYVAGSNASAAMRFELLGITPRFVEPQVLRFAQAHAARQVVAINSSTEERIRGIVSRAIAEGQVVKEIARAIESTLTDSAKPRSFAIARTEVGMATSAGDHLAARESGIRLVKVWLTANDGGERHPSEPGLEGQTREMGDLFDVRGAPMLYPLDPNGPASEVVNCRCTLDYARP